MRFHQADYINFLEKVQPGPARGQGTGPQVSERAWGVGWGWRGEAGLTFWACSLARSLGKSRVFGESCDRA